MANSTIYDIRLRYMLEDRATKGLKRMDRQIEKTGKRSSMLGDKFKQMAAGAGAYFGFQAAGKHLIGFNSNMEQAKIQMAGMLQMAGKMSGDTATRQADKLVGTLQKKAKASVGTTADMVEMASLIVRPVMAAGLGMKDLADFTSQAVVASKAFGIEAGMAARDIESALMGQLRSVDRFSRNILEPLGYIGEAGRKSFNELGAAARAAELGKALGGPGIASMAQAQAKSFSGVLSTFQDSMQMFFGKVGAPMFKAITSELKEWNSWIEKNQHAMEGYGKRFGAGIMKGFRVVKSVVLFMAKHSELLLTVAKAWAAVKIGKELGGMAESFGGTLGRLTRRAGGAGLAVGMDKAGLATAKFGSQIGSAFTSFSRFIPAIGLAAVALEGIATWWNQEKEAKARKIAGEKAEAQQLVAAYTVEKTGIAGISTGLGEGTIREAMQDLAHMQEQRQAAGIEKMGLKETALAMSLKEDMASRQAFYKGVADLALTVGATEKGAFKGRAPGGYEGTMQDYFASQMRVALKGKKGVAGIAGQVSELELYRSLGALRQQLAVTPDALDKMLRGTFVEGPMAQALLDLAAAQAAEQDDSVKKTGKINVTIQRIEVQSDDPDRFVFQLGQVAKRVAKNPSQASGVHRLG